MSASEVCDAWAFAEDPDRGLDMLVLCELPPRHECSHHGHLFYRERGVLESRCVAWEEGPRGMPPRVKNLKKKRRPAHKFFLEIPLS